MSTSLPKHLRPRAIKKRAKRDARYAAKIQAKLKYRYEGHCPSAGNFWDR